MKTINYSENHRKITIIERKYFVSYNSIIVFIPYSGNIQLDAKYWNYSRTTSKYRSLFLKEDTLATKNKINSGEYLLTNLN